MSYIVYNPKTGAPIKDFRWLGGRWQVGVNEMVKFPREVGIEILKRFGFLIRVTSENISDVKEMMKEYKFKCDVDGCDYGAETKKQLRGHKVGKHKYTKEVEEALKSVPEAKGQQVGSALPDNSSKSLSPEQMEGIPDTSRGDVDGWYGPGLEEDKQFTSINTPGQSGRFTAG